MIPILTRLRLHSQSILTAFRIIISPPAINFPPWIECTIFCRDFPPAPSKKQQQHGSLHGATCRRDSEFVPSPGTRSEKPLSPQLPQPPPGAAQSPVSAATEPRHTVLACLRPRPIAAACAVLVQIDLAALCHPPVAPSHREICAPM